VLDAIERDLERGKQMVYPDRNAAFVVWRGATSRG